MQDLLFPNTILASFLGGSVALMTPPVSVMAGVVEAGAVRTRRRQRG